jgi:primosomal protein N' (replication factor Y)
MGKLYGASVVLGSATPSLNTYVKFPHIRLKGGHVLAKKEYIFEAAHESMSPLVYHHLKNNLTAKKQAIIFLPTRANFKYLSCKSCGENFECPYCSVAMSIHNKYNALKCHYCNFSQAIPQSCPTCNATTLSSDRMGTAEVVKELLENIPEIKVQQFDRDTITTANKLKRALQSFNDKKSDVLVGTQMLSKGHDYHGVELAVIFGMDNMLNIADYRAREKALSTLIQVAGRSGRASEAKVLIQTFNESFFKEYIENYELFLEEEKLFREGLYPPYKKLCRIMFAHKNGQKAQNEMEMMREALQRFNNVEIVGAKKCAIEKVANKYRFEILLRADKATDILKALKSSQTPLAQIDMDPIDFS